MSQSVATRPTRSALLLGCAVLLVLGALAWVGQRQSAVATDTAEQARIGGRLLASTFDLESSVDGFVVTGEPAFLDLQARARRRFDDAVSRARADAAPGPVLNALARQEHAIDRWSEVADAQVEAVRAGGPAPDAAAETAARHEHIVAFRAAYDAYLGALGDEHVATIDDATMAGVAVIIATGLVFIALRYLLVVRTDRRRARRVARDAQLTRQLLAARAEDDARPRLADHLERILPNVTCEVVSTSTARSTSCAVATALPLADERGDDATRPRCHACADVRRSVCTPIRSGPEVIAVVTVRSQRRRPIDVAMLDQAIAQVTPALAHLHQLSIAETHAATDALTALPNRRAADDALRMLVAQADRGGRPLSALVVDIDHFKEVNDRWGHDRGDAVLAGVAGRLRSTIRLADFVARTGGEEFLVLLPGTSGA
ncbi:MAG TPA: diguanylate cyclase, partial [Acidimicrobiia bacterium]|nr:diguanylate cyclase [Acidimicrobiia bacterium]